MKLYEMKGKMKEMAKDVMDYKEECKDDADEMYKKKKKMKEMQDKELEEEFFGEGDDSEDDVDEDTATQGIGKNFKPRTAKPGPDPESGMNGRENKKLGCGRSSLNRNDNYKACGKTDQGQRGKYFSYEPGAKADKRRK